VVKCGGFGLETTHHFLRVQSQGARIGAHEGQGVGIAGESRNAPFLKRFQVWRTNAQIQGDTVQ
jgi:hypothetical protein